MYFHSISSLIIFLPFIFIFYPITKRINIKLSKILLLLFSFVFYSFNNTWFIIPLLISGISDYFISRELILNPFHSRSNKLTLLILSFFINLGLLITFKYSLLLTNTFSIFNSNLININLENIILPAGISFYTFQTLSFSIDSFKGKILKMPSFLDYLLYVSYFPQLVAGPILRPEDFFDKNSNSLIERNLTDYKNGFTRICFGLFLKLSLADELAILNDSAFQSNFYDLGFLDAWTMSFGFGLQIYFDFSAYSHMAIGISKIIGLPIKENFIFPYSATSATIFWRKWHVSLSKWVSDYLYKFLNKNLPIYFYGLIPLLLTWAIMGIWHGASWRFAMWGILNGILILLHRIYKSSNLKNFKLLKIKFFAWFLTLFSIMPTWIYFRSTTWAQANYLFKTLFNIQKLELGLRENYYLIVFILSIFTALFGFIFNSNKIKDILENDYFKLIGTSLAFSLAIIFINRQTSFIYFQF